MRTTYAQTTLTMWAVAAGVVAITLIVFAPHIQIAPVRP